MVQNLIATALQEIKCTVTYCMFPHHMSVSGHVQLKRVPEFSTQIYKIGTLVTGAPVAFKPWCGH